MEGKKMKDVSLIKQTQEGVIIEVVGEGVDSSKVEQVVERCKTGQCSCMTDEMKQRVSFMDFKIKDGKSIIEIKGNITKEDIKEAMGRSTYDVSGCCEL